MKFLSVLFVAATFVLSPVSAKAGTSKTQGLIDAGKYIEAVATLSGLQPTHYARRRKPLVSVGRELKRYRWPEAVLMQMVKVPADFHQPSELKEFPTRIPDAKRRELVALELPALQAGAMMALAESKATPTLKAFFVDIASEPKWGIGLRRQALRAIGRAGDLSFLQTIAQAPVSKDDGALLRQAAILAMGEIRSVQSIDALASTLNASDVGERLAALSALAHLGARSVASKALRAEVGIRLVGFLDAPQEAQVLKATAKTFGATVEARGYEALKERAKTSAQHAQVLKGFIPRF